MLAWVFGSGLPKAHKLTAPGTEGLRYGLQSLKPAVEPICLAQRPMEGTGTANWHRYGTGALNIDSCRVPTNGEQFHVPQSDPANRRGVVGNEWQAPGDADKNQQAQRESTARTAQLGRWPANLIHSGEAEVLAAFPQTAAGAYPASRGPGAYPASRGPGGISSSGHRGQTELTASRTDAGSAARYFAQCPWSDHDRLFYVPKASAADRCGSKHPTCKPLTLMHYLCRLIVPPGGHVLDPFAGSGTTGQAAREEGFHATLIERHGPYVVDIMRRLNRAP
jgi:site-specific DNA-methyltransferase (adenine-specific)